MSYCLSSAIAVAANVASTVVLVPDAKRKEDCVDLKLCLCDDEPTEWSGTKAPTALQLAVAQTKMSAMIRIAQRSFDLASKERL